MSNWTSFVKIWKVSNCEFNANFLTFLDLYHLLYDLETIRYDLYKCIERSYILHSLSILKTFYANNFQKCSKGWFHWIIKKKWRQWLSKSLMKRIFFISNEIFLYAKNISSIKYLQQWFCPSSYWCNDMVLV